MATEHGLGSVLVGPSKPRANATFLFRLLSYLGSEAHVCVTDHGERDDVATRNRGTSRPLLLAGEHRQRLIRSMLICAFLVDVLAEACKEEKMITLQETKLKTFRHALSNCPLARENQTISTSTESVKQPWSQAVSRQMGFVDSWIRRCEDSGTGPAGKVGTTDRRGVRSPLGLAWRQAAGRAAARI